MSSIAKDFAGCRASGGPNSRKLYDDGTPEHQNLNFSREPSRFPCVHPTDPTAYSKHEFKWEIPIELTGLHRQLKGDPEFKEATRMLFDFTGTTKLDHSAAKFAEVAETATFAGAGKRRALVATPKTEIEKLLGLWVLHRQTRRDSNLKLFHSVERAMHWLGDTTGHG